MDWKTTVQRMTYVETGGTYENASHFWATVCKTVRPILLNRCLSVCPVLSVTMVYSGQTVGWIKMPLSREAGLGPGDIVLGGDPAPSPKGAHSAKRSPILFSSNAKHTLVNVTVARKIG